MKEIFINPDNLQKEDINETVTRAKALIVNDKQEVILGFYFGTYQFPGGHVDEDENIIDCLKREVLEEVGLEVKEENPKPFASITYYVKNYRDDSINRENIMYYYLIKTNEEPDLSKTHYDEFEKIGEFEIAKVHLNDIEELLKNSIPLNPVNEVIVEEMLEIINLYKHSINMI